MKTVDRSKIRSLAKLTLLSGESNASKTLMSLRASIKNESTYRKLRALINEVGLFYNTESSNSLDVENNLAYVLGYNVIYEDTQ